MDIRPEMLILVVLMVATITYLIIQNNQQPTCPTCPVPRTVYIRQPEKREDNNSDTHNGGIGRDVFRGPQPGGNVPSSVSVDVNEHVNVMPPSPSDQLRDFDYRAYHDKLMPPRHRNIHEPEHLNPALLPIYTQGPPQPYRKVGILIATVESGDPTPTYQILNLIGSKISSGQYNYFAVPTRTDDNAKFEIDGKNELFTDDSVTITALSQAYTVQLDKNALPLYAGYV